ncbi:aspartate kinase [Desulfovibrio subterraneus]|jgi:aspartate kinase|uniref:Aspartokinase n=1 Tax=Desulfovibrio subterraneus TaxID=2718620 RepID=A0A7J0BL97_9BACT|nr:aspartate kinase [Desulfovibrio subterraneus]WBF68108.1 aspartate kinase [Desulfovibrio subterraneus]GFM33992.1 aspartokinase [Desulfovibrio subterraneus]
MRILVQKFGGTSVANLECMKQVREKTLAARAKGYKVVVVLSARSGDTNKLLALADEYSRDPDSAEVDSLVSTGEQVSVALFAMIMKDAGVKARSLLGFQIPMKTDQAHGKARILGIDNEKLTALLNDYDVLAVAGFQGITECNRITTLGRGGSDTSAVALAAALGCECEIYTDVDGVYTTDPNMCSTARKMDRVSYDEMLEMASMGAKVLQIRSVEFAKKYKVPVHVRSTFTDTPGTLVTQEDSTMEAVLVSGIAYDKDQARVTLRDVPDVPGVAYSLFGPLADKGVVVDMIVQNPSRNGKTDMTFTVPRGDLKKTLTLMEEIKQETGAAEVLHDLHVSKVSAIGVGMRNHSGVAAKAFAALRAMNINILMISTSEIKITCLIEEKYTELAVRTLHDAFGLDKDSMLG